MIMRSSRSAAGKIIAIIAAFCLSGCQSRTTQSINTAQSPLITVQAIQQVISGNIQTLNGLLPTQVTVTPTINQAVGGGGYILQLNWRYTAPQVPDGTDWGVQWNLGVVAGADDNSLQPVFLGGPVNFTMSENLQWISNTPMTNQLYVFTLSALIMATSNSQLVGAGEVALETIRVDLRGL